MIYNPNDMVTVMQDEVTMVQDKIMIVHETVTMNQKEVTMVYDIVTMMQNETTISGETGALYTSFLVTSIVAIATLPNMALHETVTIIQEEVAMVHYVVTMVHDNITIMRDKVTMIHNEVTMMCNGITISGETGALDTGFLVTSMVAIATHRNMNLHSTIFKPSHEPQPRSTN